MISAVLKIFMLALRIVFNSGTEKVREIDAPFVIILRTSSATQLVYFLPVFPSFNALKQLNCRS